MIYLELFWIFFKIGLFTFGGGYAMIPMIQDEVVSKGWMSGNQLVNFIAVSESTPGPFAINVSTYVGVETGGLLGAFCSTLGVVMPSFIIILIIAKFMKAFRKSLAVRGCMTGLKPCVVGLLAASALSIGITVFFGETINLQNIITYSFITSAIIFLGMTGLIFIKKISPILIIVLSAVLGIAFGYLEALF